MANYLSITLLFLLMISVFTALTSADSNPDIFLPSGPELKLSADCPSPDSSLNHRPVIGIITHPGDGASGRFSNDTDVSYIATSYVKFVESAGARVIPLIYNEPTQNIIQFEFLVETACNLQKLHLVNGVMFPGGAFDKGQYFEVLKLIYQKVLEKNDAGDHFPLFGINLGFQLLTIIVSEDRIILERFNANNQASKLQLVDGINVEGTLFQRFPSTLLQKLSTECIAMQSHRYGIPLEKFVADEGLNDFFNILTTSVDKDNKVYVSTIQAKSYPVVAVQWSPEKNAFEWGLSEIPHTEDAILVSQSVANYFVSEARKSSTKPAEQDVLDNLIYKYRTFYSGQAGKGYDEVYIFP